VSALAWCGVAVLGGLGAVARVLVAASVSDRVPSAFPFGTFVVNVSGAFLLGLVAGLGASGDAYRLAGIALLGSYTTFSTWMLETRQLSRSGKRGVGLAYVIASVAVGLTVVAIGRWFGEHL
jgi:fluoride exporter